MRWLDERVNACVLLLETAKFPHLNLKNILLIKLLLAINGIDDKETKTNYVFMANQYSLHLIIFETFK